jgi:hypothetical protein
LSVARFLAAPGYLRTNKHRRLAATIHRSTMPRQCGDAVLRMLVTGGPPNFGGGGIPQRIITISRSP